MTRPFDAIDRQAIDAALMAGEPTRREALSVALNAMAAVGSTLAFAGPWLGGSYGQTLLGLVAAAMIWRLSNFLWRPRAVAIVAHLIGPGVGQAHFDTGLAAIDWAQWWEALGLRGRCHVAWRSSGKYRDAAYSMQEVTVHIRPHKHQRRETTHHLVIEIAVPVPFRGTIEIHPASGFITQIDEALRKLTGDDLQRIRLNGDFDAAFDTLATDTAETETVLTPSFQATMLSLAEQHPALSGRFNQGWFKLDVSVPDLTFSPALMTTPLPKLAPEVDRLWWELTVPHRLIDALKGDHSGRLR